MVVFVEEPLDAAAGAPEGLPAEAEVELPVSCVPAFAFEPCWSDDEPPLEDD